ncbi:DUF4145 domain-containing protein [Serratia marcescens]|uniref:DUF4145 domain-containing protein n=1 Tax=Serratia marcescens TaxID=615 RepID=UPI0018D7935B|nr:DUF4145 domain-containing protein [Serratia marcescens]
MLTPSLLTIFRKNDIPLWCCPSCFNDTLELVSGSFFSENTSQTALSLGEDWFEPEHYKMIFSCMLRCSRSSCKEHVAVSGKGWAREAFNEEMTEKWYEDVYQATYFYPPLPIIIPPEDCPEEICIELGNISALLPVSLNAGVNAMRSTLELLLDDLNIPRQLDREGKKSQILKLHERIDNYKSDLGEYHAVFMALKWLGNYGSHGDKSRKGIREKHIEDACEILDALINKIYQRQKDISDKVARIQEYYAPTHFGKKNI